jgi:hypothetical protein
MDAMYNFAIWWLTEDECRLILETLANGLPRYVRSEVESMLGRPKRGRLWIPDGIPNLSVPEDNPVLQTSFIYERGGIVIHAADASHILGFPGYVTTIDLRLPWKFANVLTPR